VQRAFYLFLDEQSAHYYPESARTYRHTAAETAGRAIHRPQHRIFAGPPPQSSSPKSSNQTQTNLRGKVEWGAFSEPALLQTSAVVYCAVDSLVPVRGPARPGFDEFSAALDHAGVPIVWVSSRSRLQLDEPRRRLGHTHPFIAEGGSAVYLPEGYFNLKAPRTMRLGRFTTIPVAEPQPAAHDAVEELSEKTGVPVVALSSLSSRELAQNLGVPSREAESARHRDFDELFFLAGASEQDAQRFLDKARQQKLVVRNQGSLWSLAAGADLKRCIRELSSLYDRVLHKRATVVGIANSEAAQTLFPACDRSILLVQDAPQDDPAHAPLKASREVRLSSPDSWERVLESIIQRR
jgi:mannosyl-3-phosphoglycerate phosphatase